MNHNFLKKENFIDPTLGNSILSSHLVCILFQNQNMKKSWLKRCSTGANTRTRTHTKAWSANYYLFIAKKFYLFVNV